MIKSLVTKTHHHRCNIALCGIRQTSICKTICCLRNTVETRSQNFIFIKRELFIIFHVLGLMSAVLLIKLKNFTFGMLVFSIFLQLSVILLYEFGTAYVFHFVALSVFSFRFHLTSPSISLWWCMIITKNCLSTEHLMPGYRKNCFFFISSGYNF